MDSIISAAPNSILTGIQDDSTEQAVIVQESTPVHLPQVYLFGASGPTLPQLVDDSSAASIYGAATFDPSSPYCTHQTILANQITANGGSMMVQRVLPNDATPPATLALYLDLLAEPAVPQYQRATDGTYLLDNTGKKQQIVGAGATAPGYIGKWVLGPFISGPLGQASQMVGSLQASSGGGQSILIPILEFQTTFVGTAGNNLGVIIWAPTVKSDIPVNTPLIESALSYVYRLQFVSRSSTVNTPQAVYTVSGDPYVDFTFTEGVVDPNTAQAMSFDQAVIPAYENLDQPGFPPTYGPFQQMYVYQENLSTVLQEIYNAEASFGLLGTPPNAQSSSGLVNIFGATDPNGVPYYSFVLDGPANGGLLFSENTAQFATGGFDGTMNNTTFDAAVQEQLLGWGTLEAPLADFALYPQSVIYDSGYTLDTKIAMLTPLGVRKDIAIVLSTQDVSLPQNTGAQESSIAVALRTAANNYPESTFYGTSVCRALIIGSSGRLIGSTYKGLLPLTIEFCAKAIAYMGAGNGIFKSGKSFSSNPGNILTLFRGINTTEKTAAARNTDWNTGLVWVLNYDRKSQFWPALQTVYADDTSVLNSAINMFIMVEVEKVCNRVWQDLTGTDNLTANQFIDRSNKLIEAATTNRFDGRVQIVPNTYMTKADTQRGYSWACQVKVYAPTMRTVGTFTVTAMRIEDYPSGG
jgi:hypothetical protein